jgi:hypothetical protein
MKLGGRAFRDLPLSFSLCVNMSVDNSFRLNSNYLEAIDLNLAAIKGKFLNC